MNENIDPNATPRKSSKNLKKTIQTIVAVTGFLASAIGVWVFFFSPEPVLVNTEILVDSSKEMSGSIDGPSKMEAAQSAISKILQNFSDRDNLALRSFGGACDDDNATHLIVKFGQKNKKTIDAKIQSLVPEGKATMVQAVREAVADFNPVLKFPGTKKTIVMVLGSCDDCVDNPIETIRQRVIDTDINLDWKFIGLNVDQDCYRQLARLSKNASVFAARSQGQLLMAMGDALSKKQFRNFSPEIHIDLENNKVTVQAQEVLSFSVTASDPNLTQPSLSALSLPDGAEFKRQNDETYEFSWSPRPDQIGEHIVSFKASDGTLETLKEIHISVLPSDDDPGDSKNGGTTVIDPKPSSSTLQYPGLISFDFDSSVISKTAEARLKELVSKLKAYHSVDSISITGHTCSEGASDYNKKLGMRRAEAVKTFLSLSGLTGNMHTESMGEDSPKFDNTTETERKKNRRVDIEITVKGF